jgi:hypothetical protein
MGRVRRSAWPLLGLALILSTACSRQPEILPPTGNGQAQSLPFASPPQSTGTSPTQAFASTSIPAGTAIVVRLRSPLSSAESHAGDQFQAILEEPIVVQGQTLAAKGTAITGTVLAVKVSLSRAPGYLRLALSSVVLNGKTVDIHTSSVFSKGGPREYSRTASHTELPPDPEGSGHDVQFSTARRLTFRLIEPLTLRG